MANPSSTSNNSPCASVNDCAVSVDACPKQAGVTELKGCPDVDTDGDGVPDRRDACRTEAGVLENEGCPAKRKQLVVITKDKLLIKEKAYFATGKSSVLPRAKVSRHCGLLEPMGQGAVRH